jgi:hypothetical protein
MRGKSLSSDRPINELCVQVDHTERRGQVSQSGQFAPFNAGWYMGNISGIDYGINDDEVTKFNTFNGNAYQQSTSGLAYTNQDC